MVATRMVAIRPFIGPIRFLRTHFRFSPAELQQLFNPNPKKETILHESGPAEIVFFKSL